MITTTTPTPEQRLEASRLRVSAARDALEQADMDEAGATQDRIGADAVSTFLAGRYAAASANETPEVVQYVMNLLTECLATQDATIAAMHTARLRRQEAQAEFDNARRDFLGLGA